VEVAAGVHRLTKGICNWYVVEDAGKLVVVDAGTPRDWELLVETVGRLGHRLDDIEAVVVTHAHPDHTGFAERVRATAAARVWVHEADLGLARGARQPKTDGRVLPYLVRAELYRTFISLVRRGATRVVPIRELSTFADGEVLDVPGHPRVVHAPGHTPGTSAIHFEERSVLMTGDALVTRNPLTGRLGPQVMPSGLNQDTPAALSSLAALLAVSAGTVLPGHGEPWTEGVSEAVRAAQHAGAS